MLGFAVELLADQHRPWKNRNLEVFFAGVVNRDVDDECDGPLERRPVRHVERFGNVGAMLERKLGYLRVRQKRQFAFELVGKNGPPPMALPGSRSR